MGLVIDTSAVVAADRGTIGWEALGEDALGAPVALPAAVYAELLAGVHLADTPDRAASRRARIDALAHRVPIIPFGLDAAGEWARLFAHLHRAGTPLPSNDLAVAATARALGYGVLVGPRGEAHFHRVPDLKVVRVG